MKKQVVKVLISNDAGEYLVLWRSDYRAFPNMHMAQDVVSTNRTAHPTLDK